MLKRSGLSDPWKCRVEGVTEASGARQQFQKGGGAHTANCQAKHREAEEDPRSLLNKSLLSLVKPISEEGRC